MHIEFLAERLQKQGYSLSVEQSVINMLASDGFDPEYGARPVRRLLQQRLEDEIAEHILKGIFQKGDTICVIKRGPQTIEFLPKKQKSLSSHSPHFALSSNLIGTGGKESTDMV